MAQPILISHHCRSCLGCKWPASSAKPRPSPVHPPILLVQVLRYVFRSAVSIRELFSPNGRLFAILYERSVTVWSFRFSQFFIHSPEMMTMAGEHLSLNNQLNWPLHLLLPPMPYVEGNNHQHSKITLKLTFLLNDQQRDKSHYGYQKTIPVCKSSVCSLFGIQWGGN